MANIITCCRILCGIALSFVGYYSPAFYPLYLLGGLTDLIDGPVARWRKEESALGAKLDTLADIVFFLGVIKPLIPDLILVLLFLPSYISNGFFLGSAGEYDRMLTLSGWLFGWIFLIAAIKVINILYGFATQKQFVAVHSWANKITGFLLYCFIFTIGRIPINYSVFFICLVATMAALQENYLIRRKDGQLDE